MRIILLLFIITSTILSADVHWADKVISFSTEFKYDKHPMQYRASQILGEPSAVPGSGTNPCAYTPATKTNKKPEYIEVGFSNSIYAEQVAINETYHAGSITKVIVKSEKGEFLEVYKDTLNINRPDGRMLNIYFDKSDFKVSSVYIEMNTAKSLEFNQIDAVAISDSKEPVKVEINLAANGTTELINLGDRINSKADEMLPVVTPDGESIYLVRAKHPDNVTKQKQNAWKFELNSSEPGKLLPRTINRPNNNAAICSVTPDGQKFLLLNVYKRKGKNKPGLSFSERTKDGWKFPEEVNIIDYKNKSKYGEFSLSNSGNVIIMAIKSDFTYGNKDLYISFKKDDDTWTTPKNLGPVLNTAASEISPFISSDERTLYFASSGHPGYGKADIFMTKRIGDDWFNWTKPVNMGKNINSDKFDAYLSIPAKGDYIYLSSYNNSIGGADIFKAKLPSELSPGGVTLIKGVVRNSKTEEPIGSSINYYSLKTGKKVGAAISDSETGKYQITLPSGTTYGFSAKKPNFLPVSSNIEVQSNSSYQEIERDLYLTPIEKGAKITLNNIYFDTGKYNLRKESYVELNQLYDILKDSKFKILISGHTDNVGTKDDNQILSENRARAVVNYLSEKGINKNRLESKGLGEDNPVAENNSAANRQKNRRVEFEILEL